MGIFCLLISYLNNKIHNYLNIIGLFFITVFFFLIIDALFQKSFGISLTMQTSGEQITGVFGDEKILGSYISRLLPVIIGFFIISKYKILKNNYFIFFILLLSLIIILLSGERAALVNFFSFMFFFTAFKINNFHKKLILKIIILSGFLGMFITFNESINERIWQTAKHELKKIDGSIITFSDHHQLHYLTAISIFRDYPFIGSGPKMFRKLCSDKKYFLKGSDFFNINFSNSGNLSAGNPELANKILTSKGDDFRMRMQSLDGCSTHPHHTHIQILSETGLFGYLLFLLCIIFFLKLVYTSYRKKENFQFKFCMLIAILINFSPFVPSGNFFNNYLSIVYFIPIFFILTDYLIKNKI